MTSSVRLWLMGAAACGVAAAALVCLKSAASLAGEDEALDSEVDSTVEDSFPASDPPSSTGAHA